MERIAAAVAGATGLVGGRVLARLLDDPAVARVVAPTRRPLTPHPKLVNPRTSGPAWPDLAPLDEAYACLGTTMAKSGSPAAFRAVDLELTRAFALAAKAAGARRFGLVSSTGADARSRFLYPRVKAEAEAAVAAAGFASVVVARPSFLLGERAEERPGEKAALAVFSLLDGLLAGPLRRWRAVPADAVAAALIAAVRGRVPGTLTLESEELRRP